jgi:signal transduction histidine kinase
VRRNNDSDERLLVLMPTAKDAERVVTGLGRANISALACKDMLEMCREIEGGAGAALLTEEAIIADHNGHLKCVLQAEPAWSGFPLIVLVREGGKAMGLPDALALNVTLVERPLRMMSLKSVVDTALRHRRRQYQLRSVLEELERTNRELELRVDQRTARLQESIAELEAFSYSVSHDLRSPLRAMQGYAEALLEEEPLSEQGREYLSRIQRSAARLDLLVQDVLAYSKVSKGEIRLQPIALGILIGEILRSYPELTEKATITVEPPLPSVIAHEAYLTQCIANILGNAIKFVAPGIHPQVRVWAETAGERVKICCEDNGIGIDPANHGQIFQLFGRVHSEKTFTGTGIGLAIVKKAMERMGGSVRVESELNRGSRFCLTLPKAS